MPLKENTGTLSDSENQIALGPKAVARPQAEAPQPGDSLPLGNLVRYLAWIFFGLIVGFSIFLCLMIGNNARQVIIAKQYEFARLLADNLNQQIYRRFILPTVVGFGRIALRQPAQFERLDQLVRQVIQGMNVQDLRIYAPDDVVSYTINIDNLGRDDLAVPEVKKAASSDSPVFKLESKISLLSAFFSLEVEPNSFVLHTYSPLTIDSKHSNLDENDWPIMGVLEVMQDVTADILSVLAFQRSIIAIILVPSLLIWIIMTLFLTRAERALDARVKEKERLLQQLHQNEKLAGMGRVISGIAHEIRNPLGIICSSAQLLLQRTKDTDKSSAGILQAIYDEGVRLSQTVTDFLDYARPKTPRNDQVDILALLDQALAFLGPEFEKRRISLEKNYQRQSSAQNSAQNISQPNPANEADKVQDTAGQLEQTAPNTYPDTYIVTGDKTLLYRAFYNVLINAAQAVGESACGKIRLMAREFFEKEISNSFIEIMIADNGPGFETGSMSRFLDPFFTTKPLGSGLGLPIVSSIITSHGGTLEIMNMLPHNDAERSSGALVRIVLPCTRKQK